MSVVHRLVCSETPAYVHPDRVVELVTQAMRPQRVRDPFADQAINTPYLQELTTTFINVAKRPAFRSTATGSPAE